MLGPTTKQLHLNALNNFSKTPPVKAKHAPPATASPSPLSPIQSPPSTPSTPSSSYAVATKRTISIQHMSVQKAKPNQRVLYDVITFLKEIDRPATLDEVHTSTGHDIRNTAGMIEALQSNEKIQCVDGWYSYKPAYSVKNIHELRELINNTPEGIEVPELKDCYKTVDEDIKKLQEQQDVILIRNDDTKSEVAYPNDPRLRIMVSDEFKLAWSSIALPDVVDMQREMRAAGMTIVDDDDSKSPQKRPSKKKEKQQRKRVFKYTNVHMLGTNIDITKDYQVDGK